MKHTQLRIGQNVYHKDIYNGRELMEIIGIKKDKVELEGDYSGGTNNVCQSDWEAIQGVITYEQHIAKEIMESADTGLLNTNEVITLLTSYRKIVELENEKN
jgi:hypothetical protein